MFSRDVLNALMPPGMLWVVKDDGTLDLMYDGWSATFQTVQEFLASLAYYRNPTLTPDLESLEKEFAVSTDTSLTEDTRRTRLLATMTAGDNTGTIDYLQTKLQASGFNIQVHSNGPTGGVPPYIGSIAGITCGNLEASCGSEVAVCGQIGERPNSPAVNPTLFIGGVSETTCGNSSAACGNGDAMFGNVKGDLIVNGDLDDAIPHVVPSDPGYWPLIPILGGEAVRNDAGELESVSAVTIKASRADELKTLIVRYKPLHSWCGLVVNYTSDDSGTTLRTSGGATLLSSRGYELQVKE